MSTRNGDKARANRERKKKELRSRRTQELRKAQPSKTAEPVAPAPADGDDQFVTSRLRQLPEDKGAAEQGEGLEIVVYRTPTGEPNA